MLVSALAMQPVSAETSTSAPVSVSVTNVGKLTVTLGPDPVAFLGEDGGVPGVASDRGAVAYATAEVVISDTRSDEVRSGYAVNLRMGPLAIEDAAGFIDPGNIRVTRVTGLPDGLAQGFEREASLGAPVELFRTGERVPAVEPTTVSVSMVLEIPAGTMPGTFGGDISVEVVPTGL